MNIWSNAFEELAVLHEARLIQHLLCSFVQWRQRSIDSWESLKDTTNVLGHVQVIGDGNAVAALHLEDFVFAVAVEGSPLKGIGVCVAPVEEGGVTFVAYAELATYREC